MLLRTLDFFIGCLIKLIVVHVPKLVFEAFGGSCDHLENSSELLEWSWSHLKDHPESSTKRDKAC